MLLMKYGAVVDSGIVNFSPNLAKMGASVVLKKKSGRYVIYSGGYFIAASTSAATLCGYIQEDTEGLSGGTTPATNGGAEYSIAHNIDQFACELPYATAGAAGTLTQAVLDTLMFKAVDLLVTANVQYANCSSTSQAILVIVGGSVERNTVFVKVKNAAMYQ